MNILAVDPGTEQGAYLTWDSEAERIVCMGLLPNQQLLQMLREDFTPSTCYVEMVQSYGMPVGKEVFETVLFIGRVVEIMESRQRLCHLVYRSDVKQHHCHSAKAKDSNIAQALRDKYGEKGTAKNPGKLYGVHDDIWSALAIATMIGEQMKFHEEPLTRQPQPQPQPQTQNCLD